MSDIHYIDKFEQISALNNDIRIFSCFLNQESDVDLIVKKLQSHWHIKDIYTNNPSVGNFMELTDIPEIKNKVQEIIDIVKEHVEKRKCNLNIILKQIVNSEETTND